MEPGTRWSTSTPSRASGPGPKPRDRVGEVVDPVEPLDDDALDPQVVAPHPLDQLGVVHALDPDPAARATRAGRTATARDPDAVRAGALGRGRPGPHERHRTALDARTPRATMPQHPLGPELGAHDDGVALDAHHAAAEPARAVLDPEAGRRPRTRGRRRGPAGARRPGRRGCPSSGRAARAHGSDGGVGSGGTSPRRRYPGPMPRPGLPTRTRAAALAGSVTARVSRLLGRGEGTVIGGRVSLLVDPDALGRLGAGHRVSLVSGTNGKTTTTRLLAAALATAGPGRDQPAGVATCRPGLVAGPGRRARPGRPRPSRSTRRGSGAAAAALHPATVTLLNLSRDQLDRVAEVRRLAERWRDVVVANPDESHVVANADDPLVRWAASAAAPDRVTWVAAGQPWTDDAAGLPGVRRADRARSARAGWACCAAAGSPGPQPGVCGRRGRDRRRRRATVTRLALRPARPGQPGQRGDGGGHRVGWSGSASTTRSRRWRRPRTVDGRYRRAGGRRRRRPAAAGQEPGRLARGARHAGARRRAR